MFRLLQVILCMSILSQNVCSRDCEFLSVPTTTTLSLGEVGLDFRYNYQTLFLLWQPDEEFKEIGIRVGLYPKNLSIIPNGLELGVKFAMLRGGYPTGKVSLKAKIWREGRKYPSFAIKLYSTIPATEMKFAGISFLLEKQAVSGVIKGICGVQAGGGQYHMLKPFANFLFAGALAPFGPRFHIMAEYTGKFTLGTILGGVHWTILRDLSVTFSWLANLQTLSNEERSFGGHYGASINWVFGLWDSSIK